jgi:hypothetical protein
MIVELYQYIYYIHIAFYIVHYILIKSFFLFFFIFTFFNFTIYKLVGFLSYDMKHTEASIMHSFCIVV